jgi:diguanylate cyclase (GGDEF)-like protein
LSFGHFAIDGSAPAQTVRLVIIALFGGLAILAATVRERRDRAFARARTEAAEAEVERALARQDILTGLLNRRGFLENFNERPESQDVCLAILDCDNFKVVNDRYGHSVGDEYLAAAAQRISGALSEGSQVSRWGGDEFLVVLELPIHDARRVIERLRCTIMANPIATSAGAIAMTVSAGLSAWRHDDSFATTLARADQALYAAKHDGRNMTVIARTDARRTVSV